MDRVPRRRPGKGGTLQPPLLCLSIDIFVFICTATGLWRELGGGVREIGGAIRGQTEVLGRFRAELEDRLRRERVSLGKEHSEAVRGIESKAGEFYRGGMEGSEKRARGGGALGRALTGVLPSS